MKNYTEMEKLHNLLTEAGIPHVYDDFINPIIHGKQIRMYADTNMTKRLDDAVCHPWSRGYSEGLLETYILNDCEGWETAEDVFNGWQEMYRKANQPKDTHCDCTIIGADGEKWEGSAPTWD